MRQSRLFTKTKKDTPKDEVSLNAQLLIRAGFVHKEMAGVYTFLPLGLRVINKISNIVKEEMDKIGGLQVKSTALQKKEIWEKTDRWSDEVVDNWFKTRLKNDSELGLAFTHEEAFSNFMKQYISSYKDLPAYPYDIRTMFRNELRSKSGIMRGREFYWKALYSFSKDEIQHEEFYEKSKIAYKNVFERVGVGDITYLTFASGGTFSKYSHEFQTISEAGEDIIYLDEKKGIAINREVFNDKVLADLGLERESLAEKKAIETGNIFSLGHKFSKPIDLSYADEKGNKQLVFMGCYGIGISRLMGTAVEVFNDEKGIIWPDAIAPFSVHLISLNKNEDTEKIYKELENEGVEVLYDDRELGAGAKFADADLVGCPYRVVVSEKTLDKKSVEVKRRDSEEAEIVELDRLVEYIKS